MGNLISKTVSWLMQKTLSFVLIVMVLAMGSYLIKKYDEFKASPNPDSTWDAGLSGLGQSVVLVGKLERVKAEFERRFPYPLDKSDAHKQELERNKSDIEKDLDTLEKKVIVCLVYSYKSCEKDVADFIEKTSLVSVYGQLIKILEQQTAQAEHKDKYAHWKKAKGKYDRCQEAFQKVMASILVGECVQSRSELAEAYKKNQAAAKKSKESVFQEVRSPQYLLSQSVNQTKAIVDKARKDHGNLFLSKVKNFILQNTVAAFLILFSISVTPVLIKLFFYYLVAPFAVKRPSVVLIKSSYGNLENLSEPTLENSHGVTISQLTYSISINAREELLIKGEYISDLAVEGNRATRILFSNSFPLTSLAAGLVALTQIRTDSKEVVNIQATHESLYEVGVLNIPEGTALVLKPHKLIGLVQDKNLPIKITRHWRLGSLHAWLTLQLRYMVFHGPGKLILKGCKGIQVARADSGRAINQSATIGFTANVQYSNSRTETFIPYLNGKKELFNDSFHGDSGYYIYETMPYADQKGGLFGRGIEGLTDSVLKVFGI